MSLASSKVTKRYHKRKKLGSLSLKDGLVLSAVYKKDLEEFRTIRLKENLTNPELFHKLIRIYKENEE